ncbi:DEAD/DEAH box helicase [Clostridium rectalis]|uniref:DEAD/DEAH box helicase n=1 Tax=Clostridium rectalis TaxID=2040295 RepID=UPI000F63CA07|nr:DEAD/DEAH box helicase [Clostridium rectalis]
MINSFNNLNNSLIEGLKKSNITKPTSVQNQVIPLVFKNKDIIAESETGTGKTLAYLLPLFEKINTSKKEMQTIILAPTHELVMQIHNEIKLLSKNSNINIKSIAIIGEVNIKRQIDKLKEKPQIIVGSAGRVLELIKKRKISAHTIKTIVIDEGDRLLDENNLFPVKAIIKSVMKDTQLMVFSATINEKTINTAKKLMKNPEIIKIKNTTIISDNINHMYFICEKRDKIEVLRKLLSSIKTKKAIVFINKNSEIQLTNSKLLYHHINCSSIYGNSSKEDRKKAIDNFKNGKINILIASDLAARGLDIKGITHIFNLDIPENSKEYLHRVGRTGRAGNIGTAISIITTQELFLINKFEKEFNINIKPKKIYKGSIMDLHVKNSHVPHTFKKLK